MTKPAILLSVVLLVALFSADPTRGEWGGRIADEDGVTHVYNPETPVEPPVTLELVEQWRRGGEDDDEFFGVISRIVADADGNLYALDSQLMEIRVYSPEGEFLRAMGRRGEGPGEFQAAFDLYLGPDDVLGVSQVFPGKIVMLDTQGNPAGNFPLSQPEGGGFQLVFWTRGLSDRIVFGTARQKQDGSRTMQVEFLKAYRSDGSEIAEYYTESHETRFPGMKFDEKVFSNFQSRWTLAPDGRVVCNTSFDDYELHVWNPDGSVNRIIHREEFEPLERTGEQRKQLQKMYEAITSWNPGRTFTVSDTHPAITQLAVRDDGSLWVVSSRGSYDQPEGIFATFDIFDPEGRFVRQARAQIPGDAFEDAIYLIGNRMFVVTSQLSASLSAMGGGDEDVVEDADPMEIICYEIAGPVEGAGR